MQHIASRLQVSTNGGIITIAYSCPREIGPDVYRARGYYYKVGGPHPQNYDDASLCTSLSLRSSKQEDSEEYFSAYPNPFSDEITIVNNYDSKIKSITIMDIMSNQVSDYDNHSVSKNSHMINMTSLPSGIYVITLTYEDNKMSSQRIIKVQQ